jgi:hypothetical protein
MADQRFKERIKRGMWLDMDDNVHFSLPEICAELDLEVTKENMATVRAIVAEMIRDYGKPDAQIIHQARCPLCGGGIGLARHKPGCNLLE